MPFYQQDEDARMTVDFGGGRSITFKMRGTDLDVESVRRLSAQSQQGQIISSRFEVLEARLKSPELKSNEFESTLDEIDKLRKRGDGVTMMVDYIHSAVSGWVDYYTDRKAEERGEVVPYSKENIAKMGIAALGKVVTALNEFFAFSEAKDLGKSQLMISQA